MNRRELHCSEVRDLLAEEELGIEITSERKSAVHEHLGRCADCRAAQSRERELSSMLERAIGGLAGETSDLSERIAESLPDRAPARIRTARFTRLEAIAAALLFGIGLTVGWIFRGGPAGEPPANPGPVSTASGSTAGPVHPTYVTGGNDRFSHQLSNDEWLRSVGTMKGMVVDPEDPGRFSIEFDLRSTLESPAGDVEYR